MSLFMFNLKKTLFQVDYFIYLGGFNHIDCAEIYFKCAFEKVEKTTLEVTWHGTKDFKTLETTRFAHACEDCNLIFRPPLTPSIKGEQERRRAPFVRKPASSPLDTICSLQSGKSRGLRLLGLSQVFPDRRLPKSSPVQVHLKTGMRTSLPRPGYTG
ncbi:uncharacterized protein LOC118645836 [Monomorium pharaonis]|uniref:uncharacterized protein LOC118645836 n=1 Tax=Monomorium pharaonis TaxID=307658 RepID=UPI0017468872|nr:uncharacterized protein LOC118645836 [Monomorium pharaonis]